MIKWKDTLITITQPVYKTAIYVLGEKFLTTYAKYRHAAEDKSYERFCKVAHMQTQCNIE